MSTQISVQNSTIGLKVIYSDDILMIDIQTGPIKKLHGTNISHISVFDSKYHSGFEIPTAASPSLV